MLHCDKQAEERAKKEREKEAQFRRDEQERTHRYDEAFALQVAEAMQGCEAMLTRPAT